MKFKTVLFLVIPAFISAGKPVGAGAAEEVGKQTKEVINATKDATLAVMQATPKCVGDTIYQAGYNALAAPAHAVRDGAGYVYNHPDATTAVKVGAGLGAAYGVFQIGKALWPSQEERARKAQLALQEKEAKDAIDVLNTATELRTCLNTHFRSRVPGERLPRQCHSPVRRLTLLDQVRAQSILNAFCKFAD